MNGQQLKFGPDVMHGVVAKWTKDLAKGHTSNELHDISKSCHGWSLVHSFLFAAAASCFPFFWVPSPFAFSRVPDIFLVQHNCWQGKRVFFFSNCRTELLGLHFGQLSRCHSKVLSLSRHTNLTTSQNSWRCDEVDEHQNAREI